MNAVFTQCRIFAWHDNKLGFVSAISETQAVAKAGEQDIGSEWMCACFAGVKNNGVF